jgi:hypothetical protein
MMQLVTQQEVVDRLGVGDVPMVIPSVASALKAAHLRVSAEIDSPFEKSLGNVDVFFCNEDEHNGIMPGGFFRLRLRRAFLRAAPVVICAPDIASLSDPTLSAPVPDFQISQENMVRGYVFVPDTYKGQFVQVTYDSGFAPDPTDPALVSEDEVIPDGLTEAIIAYTPLVQAFSSTTITQSRRPNEGYVASVDHALVVLQPFLRRLNFAYLPVY